MSIPGGLPPFSPYEEERSNKRRRTIEDSESKETDSKTPPSATLPEDSPFAGLGVEIIPARPQHPDFFAPPLTDAEAIQRFWGPRDEEKKD